MSGVEVPDPITSRGQAPGGAIELRLDPSGLRRWHLDFIRRLESVGVGRISSLRAGRAPPLPHSVGLLFTLEGMLHRQPSPRPTDPVQPGSLERPWESSENPDLVIDLTGDAPRRAGVPVLRPLFDGASGDAALIGALLDGHAPFLEIEGAEPGSVLARGLPSIENAESLSEAIAVVWARVATLLAAALRQQPTRLPALAEEPGPRRNRTAAAFALRSLSLNATRALYRLCHFAPHWRVGWRFVDAEDLIDRQSLVGPRWNVLPDPGFRFYADPFPIVWQGRRYIFVEDLDHRTGKGVISVVEIGDKGPIGPVTPVLEEPWHLSYPFLIEHSGSVWMIPESSADRTVSLYRADPFPHRWVREATLLTEIEASDATILRHGGRLWMFATTRDGGGSFSDTLSLFSAPVLVGPWAPHPQNPVLIDARVARPAGNIVRRDGRLWRPVQDCSRGYGSALGLAEITRLDAEAYEQTLRTVLRPGASWPGRRFHTLNRAGDLECIDGSADSPKLPWLARRLFRPSNGAGALRPVSF